MTRPRWRRAPSIASRRRRDTTRCVGCSGWVPSGRRTIVPTPVLGPHAGDRSVRIGGTEDPFDHAVVVDETRRRSRSVRSNASRSVVSSHLPALRHRPQAFPQSGCAGNVVVMCVCLRADPDGREVPILVSPLAATGRCHRNTEKTISPEGGGERASAATPT